LYLSLNLLSQWCCERQQMVINANVFRHILTFFLQIFLSNHNLSPSIIIYLFFMFVSLGGWRQQFINYWVHRKKISLSLRVAIWLFFNNLFSKPRRWLSSWMSLRLKIYHQATQHAADETF
jgi:hypothetical protein